MSQGLSEMLQISRKEVGQLRTEIERLRAIVDKLPQTADGMPVVPGMRVWRLEHPTTLGHVVMSVRKGSVDLNGMGTVFQASSLYSTRNAAEAARLPQNPTEEMPMAMSKLEYAVLLAKTLSDIVNEYAAKLPKTADGQAVIPTVDKVYHPDVCDSQGELVSLTVVDNQSASCAVAREDLPVPVRLCYSTYVAAKAAAEAVKLPPDVTNMIG